MSNVSVDLKDDNNTALVSITVDDLTLKTLMDQFYKEKQKTLTLKGFRKGTAPIEMVASYFKPEARRAAADQAIYASLMRGLGEHKLTALGEPQVVKIDTVDNELVCNLTIEVMKPVMLKKYLGIQLKKYPELELDSELKQMLDRMRKFNSKFDDIVLDSVAESCHVSLDFEIFDKEVVVESNKDYNLYLNTGMVFKGFEEKIIGCKVGDDIRFDLSFPDDFGNETFNGKTLSFVVNLKEIKSVRMPTDDELAKAMTVSTYEELVAKLTTEIQNAYTTRKSEMMEDQIIDTLIALNDFEVPLKLIEKEKQYVKVKNPKFTDEQVADTATKYVKTDIIFNAIMERHQEIALDKTYVDAKLGMLAEKSGSTRDELIMKLKENKMTEVYINFIKNLRVIDFIKDTAEFV